jgi:MFS family permease
VTVADAPVWRTVAAGGLSTVLASLPVFLLGGLAVLVRDDLAFSEVQLGLAASTFFSVAALTAVAAGRIAARTGAWAATVLAAVLSALALIGMATAPTYAVLLLALALGGAANSLAQIGTNGTLAEVVPKHRQGLAFGIKQAAIPAATLLAGFALPVVGLTLGWRASFGAAAALAVVYVLFAPRAAARSGAAASSDSRAGDAAVRALVVVAVAGALASAAVNGLAAFLVESAVTAGFTASGAGVLLGCGSALGVAARVLVGWLADRRSGGHLKIVTAMMATGAVGMALFATGAPAAFYAGTALVFALGWSWPGLMTFAVVRLNPSAPAVATSYTQTGVFAGGATGPLAFGLLVSAGSYRLAWSAAALAMVAASGLMFTGRRMLVADRARRAAAAS